MTDKKAPVFFTIAALRHEPVAAFESLYWPKVHDELRKKGYAGNVEVEDSSIQLHFGPEVPQTETRNRTWTVFTPDRQHAYSFNDGGIFSFHTSDYTTRTDLFAEDLSGSNQ